MKIILPYYDSIDRECGAFITPKGEFLTSYPDHETFAMNYFHWKENSSFETIDFSSICKLTKEELRLYKLWLEGGYYKQNYSDFLVLSLGFDKVEKNVFRTITTTCELPHIRFYNYYLMDWFIDKRNMIKYNEQTGLFEWDETNNWGIKYYEDMQMEDEINEIKSHVKIKDRHYFFK